MRGRPSRWFSRSDPRVSRARKRWKAPRFSGRCHPSRDGPGTRILAGPFLLRRKPQVAVGFSSPIAERTGDKGCSRGAKEGNAVRLAMRRRPTRGTHPKDAAPRAELTGNGGASFARSLGPCPSCRFTAAGVVVSTPSISRKRGKATSGRSPRVGHGSHLVDALLHGRGRRERWEGGCGLRPARILHSRACSYVVM